MWCKVVPPLRSMPNYNVSRMQHKKKYKQNRNQAMVQSGSITEPESQNNMSSAIYFCFKCEKEFTCRSSPSQSISGKIPLVLHCNHTLCQDCIHKSLRDLKITCPICKQDTNIDQGRSITTPKDLQAVLLPNYYIIGYIMYNGSQHTNSVKFLPSTHKKQSTILHLDKCSISDCIQKASVLCSNCEAIYCQDCNQFLHNNVAKLISHQQVPYEKPLSSFSFDLDFCAHHSQMQNEFMCKDCDQKVCCYCIIESHSTHDRENLYELTESEIKEFNKKKEDAKKILKQLLACQKETLSVTEFKEDPIKKQIHQYFSNLIAKVSTIEKQFCNEIEANQSMQSDIDVIQASLINHVSMLKELLLCDVNHPKEKKINLKEALNRIRNVHNIPRFLVSDKSVKKSIFVVDPSVDKYLEQAFTLDKSKNPQYKLVSEDQLADDYIIEEKIDEEVESFISVLTNTSQSKHFQDLINRNSGSGKVIVQHINSTEGFFVQLKDDQYALCQLNDEIENYIKVGCCDIIKEPNINDLYLALYTDVSKNEKWRRARLINITNGDTINYEMFSIDYGIEWTVDINGIRDLPAFLALRKPLAFKCKLHNEKDITWTKNDEYAFRKIVKNKEVYMFVKSISNELYNVDLMVDSSDGNIISVIDMLNKNRRLTESADPNSTPAYKNIALQTRIFPNSKKFTQNQEEQVIIANITDPYNIIVHLVANKSNFKIMCKELKKVYHSIKNDYIPLEGTYVIVQYKDPIRLNYHRAFIKNMDLNTDQVYIHLVDWGYSTIVHSNQIRPLPQQLTKLECQAIQIKMVDIAPYNKENMWHKRSNKLLDSYYNFQSVLKMVVQEISPQLEVALFDISGSVDLCLNTMMVENHLADCTGQISSQLEWSCVKCGEPDIFEEDCFLTSLLKKAITNPDSEDEAEDQNNTERRQLEVIKVESPDAFWIKFLSFSERDSKMYKELQIHYHQEHFGKESWNVDEMCVVDLETEYARGKIIEVLNNKYIINLYDKAEDICLPKEKIFIYNKYFMTYPPVAIKCHLANVNPAGDTGKWSITSIETLQKIVHKRNRLYGTIESETDSNISKKKSLPLHLWYSQVIQGGALDPDVTHFHSINKIMIKLGFAYKTISPVKLVKTGDDSSKHVERTEELNMESISDQFSVCSVNGANTKSIDNEQPNFENLAINKTISEECISSVSPNSSITIEKFIDHWLPPFQLTKKEFNARVTCVETCGHLFIRDEDMNKVYEKMQANIKEYFDKNPPRQQSNNWKVDELCTIKYDDGNWYRGKVLRINNDCKVTVFMIDFGSDHEVSTDTLYKEIVYTEYNSFAAKVKLDRVYSKKNKWLSSDYDNFHSLVTDWCKIIVVGPLEVELPLVDVYTSDGVYVNNKLVEVCPNLSRNAILVPVYSDDDYVNKECKEIEPIKSFEEHNHTDPLTHYKQPPIPEEMLEGKMIILEVAGILNYNKVILKIPNQNLSSSMHDLIIEIQDAIESFPPLKDIKLGQACLAKFSEDEVWYRGRISDTNHLEAGEVDVLYVDYGNTERLAVENVRSIPTEFLKEPQQTWEAELNIKHHSDTSYLIKQLMEKLLNTTILAKLISVSPFVVDLYNGNGEPLQIFNE